MGPDGPVELAAHLPEAGGGAHQRGLRSGERPAGLQGPAELPGVYPQHQTAVFKLAALRRRLKIAAVKQHGAPAKAVVLPRVPLAQHDEGVVLVAGRPRTLPTLCTPGRRGARLRLRSMACRPS